MLRKKLTLAGIIQGVGFRPFVYKLAVKFNLGGEIKNTQNGVSIEIEGESKKIEEFLKEFKEKSKKLTRIDLLKEENLDLKFEGSFVIKKSTFDESKTALLPLDSAICRKCLKDLKNSKSRYFEHLFTACVDCGQKYTIIKTLPYDRINTAMSEFKPCKECEKIYNDSKNRRYFAQTISCKNCSPKVTFFDREKNTLASGLEAIKKCASEISKGKIVAIKSSGGFHLVCDATNKKAIKTLRERKKRAKKPFAVMFKNIDEIKKAAILNKQEEKAIASKQRPIVLVQKNSSNFLAKEIAFEVNKLGVFLPSTALENMLFDYLKNPIISTSANISENPIITSSNDIFKKLGAVIDFCLDHDMQIINACDDSILQIVDKKPQILRLAKGYAPKYIKPDFKLTKKILAVGANQKNTIALAFEDMILVSPYIGDLDTLDSFEYFEKTLNFFQNLYDFKPDIIACDKHNGYKTVQWAKEQKLKYPNIEIIQIQHHYAHILACMAEYDLDEKVLGFAFDGTGAGDDGTIWGGEVFLADTKEYKRVLSIKPFRLIGNEKAIKEPKRVALSFLFDIFSLEEVKKLKIPTIKAFEKNEIDLLHAAWQKGLNSPMTSSTGRVFDGFTSLMGILQHLSFEGESGLLMESLYDKKIKEFYSFEIIDNQIDFKKMVLETIDDLKTKDKKTAASKFINTIAQMVFEISNQYEEPVVLSGGVFQNKTLLSIICKKFNKTKKRYYFAKDIPLNDSGIALGQIYKAIRIQNV